MIGFAVGILVSNAFEWFAHKYILHGVPDANGTRQSVDPAGMKAHWQHHKVVRTRGFEDEAYEDPIGNRRTFAEIKALVMLAAGTTLAAPVAPFFTLGTCYSAWNYWYSHRKAHLDAEWAKRELPWHYDHHMNANQDANWCVTRPWFDYVMGTRVISSREVMESNPTGMKLPDAMERQLNDLARRFSPRAFERIEKSAISASSEVALAS